MSFLWFTLHASRAPPLTSFGTRGSPLPGPWVHTVHFCLLLGYRSSSNLAVTEIKPKAQRDQVTDPRHSASQPRKARVPTSPHVALWTKHRLIRVQGVLGPETCHSHLPWLLCFSLGAQAGDEDWKPLTPGPCLRISTSGAGERCSLQHKVISVPKSHLVAHNSSLSAVLGVQEPALWVKVTWEFTLLQTLLLCDLRQVASPFWGLIKWEIYTSGYQSKIQGGFN